MAADIWMNVYVATASGGYPIELTFWIG